MTRQRPGWLLLFWIASFAGVWILWLQPQLTRLPIAFYIANLIYTFFYAANGACGWWLGMFARHGIKSVLLPLAIYFLPISLGILWTFLQAALEWYAPLQLSAQWHMFPLQMAKLSQQTIDVAWTTAILLILSRALGVYLVRSNEQPRNGVLTVRTIMIATLCVAAASATRQFIPEAQRPAGLGNLVERNQETMLLFSIGFTIKMAMLWAMVSWVMSQRRNRAIWITLAFIVGACLSVLYGSLYSYWYLQNFAGQPGISTKYMNISYQLISILVFMCGIFAVIAIVNRCGYRLVRVKPDLAIAPKQQPSILD